MAGGDELWRGFDRPDLAYFVHSTLAAGPTSDLKLPAHLEFSHEQRAFISSLVAHVVENLTYELSHKWAKHMIAVLMAGVAPPPDGAGFATPPVQGDTCT